MRRARIALLAIVLLGVAGVALIASWTREWPAATLLAEERAAPAPRPCSTAEEMPADAARRARSEPLPEPPRSARGERQARQGASTRTALVSFRREMKAGFAALQRRVARCGATDAWFTLEVETVEGGVRVVEVHLAFPGSAGDASVACARSLLLGETIPVASAKPGRRWETSFVPGSAL